MSKDNRTLMVLRYLWEQTDDEHPATLTSIMEYLAGEGLPVKDYRVIQNDVKDLEKLGLDIVTKKQRQYEYSIGSRHFDVPEVKLLVDAVQSSRFISSSKSKALIKKLAAFVGPSQADVMKRQLYVDQRSKSTNENVLRSVDTVQDAIANGVKVAFQYFDYSPRRKKVARHDGEFYVISPYSLIWSNDNYYLVGYSDSKEMIEKFRIDRIDSLSVVNEPRIKSPKDYSVRDFFTREFSMMSGTKCEVGLLAENQMMNNMIDRFGNKVKTEVVDESHFKVTTTVDLSPTFYGWIFASEGGIRILGPQEAIDGFNRLLEKYR